MAKLLSNPKELDTESKDPSGASSELHGRECSTGCKHGQQKPEKTPLEKTQSMLTVISTAIGLLGIAGSTFAFAVSSFYTGTLQIKAQNEIPGLCVKVHTSEGHESVFYSKNIKLMPGDYELEISYPGKKPSHREAKVAFNKTTLVDLSDSNGIIASPDLNESSLSSSYQEKADSSTQSSESEDPAVANGIQEENESGDRKSARKKKWWQFWKKDLKDLKDAAKPEAQKTE